MGIQVNGTKAAQKLAFYCTIIFYFTSTFLWRRLGKEQNGFDPRSLLLRMTMNKSMHKMLIHGTLHPLSKGKNGYVTTILQSALSMNVTAFFIYCENVYSCQKYELQKNLKAEPLCNVCTFKNRQVCNLTLFKS